MARPASRPGECHQGCAAIPGPPLAGAAGRDRRPRRPAHPLVTAAVPQLVALPGIGIDTAGQLLVPAGDNPARLRTERSFARLCGVAPIPASSGRTGRHRLNRGGDRNANSALWRIALVRMHCHQPTKDYVACRTAQVLSKTEILRCLKRYLAREVNPRLLATVPMQTMAT